jgi:hypothetical protein
MKVQIIDFIFLATYNEVWSVTNFLPAIDGNWIPYFE